MVSELKLAFSLFDRDKDGNISMAEVRHVMNTLGQQVNDRQLQAMFKQVDLDGRWRAPSPWELEVCVV